MFTNIDGVIVHLIILISQYLINKQGSCKFQEYILKLKYNNNNNLFVCVYFVTLLIIIFNSKELPYQVCLFPLNREGFHYFKTNRSIF